MLNIKANIQILRTDIKNIFLNIKINIIFLHSRVDLSKDIRKQGFGSHEYQIEDSNFHRCTVNNRLNIHNIFKIFVNIYYEYC